MWERPTGTFTVVQLCAVVVDIGVTFVEITVCSLTVVCCSVGYGSLVC
jgi:hypothetical protein